MQHASSPSVATALTRSCPVCSVEISSSALLSHVNSCLDASNSLPLPDDIPSPPSSPSPPCSPRLPPKPSAPSPTSISSWLNTLGLPKYTPGFLRAGFRTLSDLLAIPDPNESLLSTNCGVSALGARRKIISELSTLRATVPSQPPSSKKEKKRVWAIFEPGYHAPGSNRKRPRVAVAKTPGLEVKAAKDGEKGKRRKHFYSHRVEGTDLTVDSFYAAKHDPPGSTFFLTHFHSDHYGPLRKSTLPRGGRVLCSEVTASLVCSILRVPKESVSIIPVGKKVEMKQLGITVWAYDANHCPGAVMFLFEVWKTGRFVLHTGDCRFDPRVFEKHNKLVEVAKAGNLDYMHLDTTYCNPQYVFPHQASVLEHVVAAAREEDLRTRGRCLFFFGTYSIGKEKVFLAVAEALNLHIYAGKRKRGILEQCGFGPRLSSKLVKSASEARIQVVSMRALTADGLRVYAERNQLDSSFIGRGLAIVFRPTGWTFRGNSSAPKRVNRSTDHAMLYEIPYSEHSSYEELVAFVKWSNPARVIPTVNSRSMEQENKLRHLLGHKDRSLRATK